MDLKYIVDEQSAGKTIKYILKNKLELSERLVKKLKYSGKILCNSKPVFVNATVNTGDVVKVNIDFMEKSEEIVPEKIDIDVLYEDDCMIALNKQPGIVVHPTSSHPTGTIANGLVNYLISKGISKKVRPVSRLDRDTSGIIIFAKNQYIQESLIRQMSENNFIKQYIGVVHGIVEKSEGTVNLPIDRKPGSIMLRHVSPSGVSSITHFKVIEYLNNATYMEFSLETGRTHQIRVHCQAIGHPLIGDTLYPSLSPEPHYRQDLPDALIPRQALHSYKARFIHPHTGKILELIAPIPQDISKLLEILRK